MNRIGTYINYLIKAKGRHGIHSPFVYDFVDKCLTTKMDKNFELELKNHISAWKNDARTIHKHDLGAGSRKMKTERKVSDLFRYSSTKGRYLTLLYQLSAFYRPTSILELGTNLGLGTLALKAGHVETIIDTLEGCPETQQLAKEKFQQEKDIHFLLGDFETIIPTLNRKYDLIFVDGHHDGKALIHYMSILQKYAHDETIFLLDDIRWNDDMFQAWKKLAQSEQFHVSLDLYKMGILVPRKHQQKEHFQIKLSQSWKGLI